jgi:hypothetical protein
MIISNFINEIGNKIKIKARKCNFTAINHKTGKKVRCGGIYIAIIGPTSESGNEITIAEAEELYRVLG